MCSDVHVHVLKEEDGRVCRVLTLLSKGGRGSGVADMYQDLEIHSDLEPFGWGRVMVTRCIGKGET